jgi:cell division topological specificity factor
MNIMGFLDRLFGKKSSADAAKQRLQLVLVHDRAEIPPGVLALIKDDIIAVISRRVNIDREHVQVNISHEARESKLLVDIPLLDNAAASAPGRARGEPQRPRQTPPAADKQKKPPATS